MSCRYAFSYEAPNEQLRTVQQPYKTLMVAFCYAAYAVRYLLNRHTHTMHILN
eukprot:SAG31_NODE_1984_length_6740_cov_4.949255_9_plen_53_part_00